MRTAADPCSALPAPTRVSEAKLARALTEGAPCSWRTCQLVLLETCAHRSAGTIRARRGEAPLCGAHTPTALVLAGRPFGSAAALHNRQSVLAGKGEDAGNMVHDWANGLLMYTEAPAHQCARYWT